MDQERIQELAVLQATTGLLGADLLEFEIWWRTAPADERAHYTETLDTIAMISQSHIPARKPSPLVKSEIMASLSDSPRRGSKGKNQPAVAGYAFMMEAEGDWRELPTKGTRVKELFCSREAGTATFVLEMDPGTRLLSHHHQGAEEAFVLYGDLQMRGKVLRSGDYMRAGL